MTNFELHYHNQQSPDTALNLIANQTQLSIAQIKSAISKGALWLEKGNSIQRLRRFKKIINKGETLHLYYNEEVLIQQPPKATLIDDRQSYSVWFKPSGMLSQGSKWSDHCTITRWAQHHLDGDRACFLVHRLDRATSGLIILAHTKKAAQLFSKLFETHQLTKCYQAIVRTSCPQKHNFTVDEPIDNKSAISHFALLDCDNDSGLAFYQICIDTGRKHQIRKHCQFLRMPIWGDRLYGITDEINTVCDLQLSAVKLAFTCPITGDERQYQLPNSLTFDFNKMCQLMINSSN